MLTQVSTQRWIIAPPNGRSHTLIVSAFRFFLCLFAGVTGVLPKVRNQLQQLAGSPFSIWSKCWFSFLQISGIRIWNVRQKRSEPSPVFRTKVKIFTAYVWTLTIITFVDDCHVTVSSETVETIICLYTLEKWEWNELVKSWRLLLLLIWSNPCGCRLSCACVPEARRPDRNQRLSCCLSWSVVRQLFLPLTRQTKAWMCKLRFRTQPQSF